jgi:predicted GNAT superfamily acetyltransferase
VKPDVKTPPAWRGNRERRNAVEIRPLESQAELQECVALQRRTWGENYADIVAASILKISAKIGGVVLGAFDSGTMVGFVFGLAGVERRSIVHWSHMLAVVPEAQNQGIGRSLKEQQRLMVAKTGAKTMYWTFDPLVARNAHLNFNVVGVRATDYVRDMYGESASPMHRGIGTDRLIVSWPVDDIAVAARRREMTKAGSAPDNDVLRIEIPSDIAALQLSDMSVAREWRERTRAAFEQAFAKGYAIQGFESPRRGSGTGSYLLRPAKTASS